MPFEAITLTAPSHWAPYLVNGDASGMTEAEEAQAAAFTEQHGLCVGAEELGFATHHDAWGYSPFAGDVSLYTFHQHTE